MRGVGVWYSPRGMCCTNVVSVMYSRKMHGHAFLLFMVHTGKWTAYRRWSWSCKHICSYGLAPMHDNSFQSSSRHMGGRFRRVQAPVAVAAPSAQKNGRAPPPSGADVNVSTSNGTTRPRSVSLPAQTMRRAATFQPVVKSSSSKKTGKTVDLDAALQFDAAGMTKSAFAAQVVFVTLITTALFAGFVMFFFFVIASKVERQVVQKSVTGLVDEFVGDAQVLLPPAQLAQLRAAASTLQPPSAADADAEVTARNKSLLKHAAIVLGVAVIVIAAAVTIAYFAMRAGVKKYKPGQAKPGAGYPDMSNVLLVSVCSLAAAAVAEFAFLYTVAARYQPLDNNAAKHALVTQLLAIGAQAPSK